MYVADRRPLEIYQPKLAAESCGLEDPKRGRAGSDKVCYHSQQTADTSRSGALAKNSKQSFVDLNTHDALHAPGSKYKRVRCAVNGYSDGSKVVMTNLNHCAGVIRWIGYNHKAQSQSETPSYIVGVELLVSVLTNSLLVIEMIIFSAIDIVSYNYVSLTDFVR